VRVRKGVLHMSKKGKKHRQQEPFDEPFLLSPQFDKQDGWGKKISHWWQKYFKSVILPAIIVILIAGGIYAYTNRQESAPESQTASLGQTSQEQSQPQIEIKENEIKNLASESATETLSLGETETQETQEEPILITAQTTEIKEIALKGEGVTHLARRALKQYLQDVRPELNLSLEQKIYCEDYIQNKTADRGLEINEEISFSTEIIEAAINASQHLTSGQIQNLSQYVPSVPSLTSN